MEKKLADLLFIIALVKYVYTFHALLELSHFLVDVISDCVRLDQVRVLRIGVKLELEHALRS